MSYGASRWVFRIEVEVGVGGGGVTLLRRRMEPVVTGLLESNVAEVGGFRRRREVSAISTSSSGTRSIHPHTKQLLCEPQLLALRLRLLLQVRLLLRDKLAVGLDLISADSSHLDAPLLRSFEEEALVLSKRAKLVVLAFEKEIVPCLDGGVRPERARRLHGGSILLTCAVGKRLLSNVRIHLLLLFRKGERPRRVPCPSRISKGRVLTECDAGGGAGAIGRASGRGIIGVGARTSGEGGGRGALRRGKAVRRRRVSRMGRWIVVVPVGACRRRLLRRVVVI